MLTKKTRAYVLYNMDKPDAYNETMTFGTMDGALTAAKIYGGEIKLTFVTRKV